jgi:membrane associated rhomboid family serine protease
MSYQYRRSRVDLTPIWVIMGINIIIFLVAQFNSDIVYTLGLQPATVLSRPWTVLTYMFTHQEIFHILFNMLTLYFFGTFLVQLIGTWWALMVYFGSGILGGILFILLGSPLSVCIGASGAIFGLGGALVVLRPQTRVMAFPIPIPMPLWVAVIVGFVLISIIPGIAWQAHLGGIIFGLVAGYFLRKKARSILL